MTDNDADWVRQYYSAWDSGDAEAISSWFDDDVVVEDVPTGHIARGGVAARKFVESALKVVPGATYEVLTALTSDDHFAVEWVMRPPGLRGSSVGTIRDGKILSNRDYWDASPPKK